MVLLDDNIYQETKELILGKHEKTPLLIELSDWFMSEYSIKILNIQFNKLTGPNEKRHRLYIIIEKTEDYKKMWNDFLHPNENCQRRIALEFRRLALKHNFADASKLNNLFITYNDFSEEAKTEANWNAAKDVKLQIMSAYTGVWNVVSRFTDSSVLYFTDAEIAINEQNGLSQIITNTYYSILKKYDDLNYYTRENIHLEFDSKENLDNNFEGSLFYYSRR
ncbi:MAG: hypothetical protein ACYC0V_02130 [Armatimonadota bacterium]